METTANDHHRRPSGARKGELREWHKRREKKKSKREKREGIKEDEEAAGTKRRFLRHGIWRLFATFSPRSAFTVSTTCPSSSFPSRTTRFARVGACLPTRRARVVPADKQLEVRAILPPRPTRPRPRPIVLFRSSCVAFCARHPYASGRARVPTLTTTANELVKR